MKTSIHYQSAKLLFLSFFTFLNLSVTAQSPEVQWQNYYHPGFHKTNATYPGSSLPIGFDPTKEEYSGEDWTYDVKSVYDGATQTGFICAGFSSFVNNASNDNCGDDLLMPEPECEFFELEDYVNGQIYPKLYLVDRAGNVVWYRNYGENGSNSGTTGRFYSVIQLANGGYMAVGKIHWINGLKYNPTTSQSNG